jgi:hypothetical protein
VKYGNEIEVKKALGIDSFRNLSRDNVMHFAAMMPDMDKEVALKIVEQFPEFKAFALDAVNVMQKAQENALADNKESQAQVHQAWHEVREILKGQLGDEDLTWEQKKEILDLIVETARQESAKDSENKTFLKGLNRDMFTAIGSVVLLGVLFVGGKFLVERIAPEAEGSA